MSDELAAFYVHTATVETFTGTSGYGVDVFAAPQILAPGTNNGCFIEQKRRMVRDKDGAEVISETSLYTYPTVAALFAPGSRVTVNGTVSHVISVAANTSGELDLPDHLVVTLT